ncbi:MAG TPA: VCBS repeat-containing protein, partial [Candidatus Eisenbacteria bacterium]
MFCCILLAVALLFGARVAGARPWYNANFDGYSLASGSRIFPYNANNDAELDIITSSGNVILGMPNGDFSQGVGFTIPLSTYHMAIADQNGDGRKDVFLTGKPTPGAWGTFYLYTYQKLAGNGFTALPGIVLPEKSDVLHAGDFDGNGLADAVVFTRGLDFPDVPDTGAVYFSHPGGISPGVVFEIPMLYPIDSGVGDFDEDGRTDIVVLSAFNLNPRTLAFYLSSAGGILAAPRIDTLSTIFPGYIGVADVNDDGHDDIAFSDGRAPASFLGNGDGTFQPVYPPDVGPAWCGDLEFGDVNLDGHLDVVSNCTFNYAYIGLGDGAGRFSTVSRHWFPRGGSEESLIVNDFDHDGFGDIVGNRSPGLAVLRGNAAVTFNTVPEFPAAPNLSEVIALDWDLDGIEDLVGVDRIGGNLVLFRNRLGALEPGVTIPLGFIPDGIRFADLNGDGRRDIVAADQGADLVKVSLGSSGGGFQTPVSYPVGSDPSDVATGDFNADGILDVVVSNFSYPSWSASYLRGTGNGAFAPQVVIPTAATPSSIETGDFNEDGKLDFVTGHPFDRCSLVLGRGNGTFDPYIGVGT